jgi:hypothetical protein
VTPVSLTLDAETRVCSADDWHANIGWVERIIPLIGALGFRTILHIGDFGIWSDIRGHKFLAAI